MKPNRVPEDLIQAGSDAIRAWYAAHPSPNAYLDDRTRMRIVLAAVLTLHNEQVEQPLRERAETAERELAKVRERIGEERVEWGVQVDGDDDAELAEDEDDARWKVGFRNSGFTTIAPHGVVSRVVGKWKTAKRQPGDVAEETPWTDHGDGWKSRRPTLSDFQGPFTGLLGPLGLHGDDGIGGEERA